MGMPSFDPGQYKAGQRQEWDSAAPGWKKWREVLERGAQFVSDRMVELADIRPGHRVLDVATGAGDPAVTAARRVGPTGHVLGTDLSPAMLAIARERATTLGLRNLEFREMDAEALEFPEGSFDAALCRFGLMFLPNAAAAADRIRRSLARGGKFVGATWSVPPKVPLISLPMAVMQKALQLAPPPPGTPSVFSLSAPDAVERLLIDAGFRDVATEGLTMTVEFPSTEVYTSFLRDMAPPIRALLAKQPPERQEMLWRAVREAARSYATPDGTVRMSNEGLYVVGQR